MGNSVRKKAAPSEPVQLFTLRVHRSSGDIHRKTGLTAEQIAEERKRIFVEGFRVQASPTSWEIVSPWAIARVFIDLQTNDDE